MGSLLGGGTKQKSTSTQESHNQAYPYIQQTFAPVAESAGTANNALLAALGLGGPDNSQADAFNNYKNSAGYQSTLQAGTDAITGSQAAKGLLGSGSTLKGLTSFGQGLNQQYYGDYLKNLLGEAQLGLGAGQLIGGTGNVSSGQSNSSSKQKNGIGKLVGAGLSFIPGGQVGAAVLGS